MTSYGNTRERRQWRFSYAPQLGYRSPETPLFRHSSAVSPAAQALRVAQLGFAGVQYPWAASRPQEERATLAATLTANRLQCGCVVWASRETLSAPYWVRGDGPARTTLRENLARAMDAASELGGNIIAVLGAGDDSVQSIETQRRTMADNLRWAGDMARARNMRIGLEPMVALPNMALKTLEDALDMIERAAHPAVQIIFDTGHIHNVDTDVVGALERAFDTVCLVQFADQPGRVEPGAGQIDFQNIMRMLVEGGYSGLIELEHGWLEESALGEAEGLDRLMALDRLVSR